MLWQDAGPWYEQIHAAFEVWLSLDQGQGVYSDWTDVDGSSQLRLCHMCIIDVLLKCVPLGLIDNMSLSEPMIV